MTRTSKLELILSTFKGEPHEGVPITLWKHFPHIDRTPEGLAKAQIQYQEKFDFDLMKISPHGRHCTVDWGGTIGEVDPISGSTKTKDSPVSEIIDLEKIQHVSVNKGEFGKQVETVRIIKKKLSNSVPLMMTIFSPVMVLSYLDPNLMDHIETNPTEIKNALGIITKVMSEFAEASLDAGADGIFYASKYLTEEVFTWSQIENFSIPYDLEILKNIKNKSEFIVLHLHGKKTFFDRITNLYPISAVNWHDRLAGPSITEGAKLYSGGLLGGIEEHAIQNFSDSQIENDLQQLKQISVTALDRLVISPGCVLPITIPERVEEKITSIIKKWKK